MAISKLPGTRQPSGSSIPSQSSATAIGELQHCTDTCNIVIFGESGSGKSSLVNLISGTNTAVTSSDAGGCTTRINAYEVLIRSEMWTQKVKLFDTAGLDEGPQATVPDKEARRVLKKLVRTLMEQGNIHLIMYCVRGERVIPALRRNYKLIQSEVAMRVPIVLVVTCLESYEPEMEEWWKLNEHTISELGMIFAGHACVTAAMIAQSKVIERRTQSYYAVCKLIEQCRLSSETVVHTGPSRGAIHNVPSNMTASKHKNIVLFGQAGAGKSSLVNLMVGENVASTSSDMRSCTLHWQEYPIEFDGKFYRVFDTIGLEEPRLGISQYLDAVENAYTLIQNLERQGGIDLLLLCMRAGRLTDTVQTNYRLFHEFLCDKKVPIVVVITYLENEAGEMDNWWKQNEDIFREREIHVAGHACITAIQGNYLKRYEESRITIRKLVEEFTADEQKEAWTGGSKLFVSFIRKLRELLVGKEKLRMRKDIVPCLIKRCGLSPDVATKLADRIKNGVVERAT
ncbi:P-loop containing nucleoside triphosphate hydrolase protein [Suillus decipiens]|nr:P-loop containing nucleoside triphosphate hydrolase protein [Suillus decipiens]